MAQSNNKTVPRARLAHKLAKYVRATPVHLPSRLSSQNPTVSHLSILYLNFKDSEVLKKED